MRLTDIQLRRVPHIDSGETLEEAARALRAVHHPVLPVVEKGCPIGTLSENELESSDRSAAIASESLCVADVCRRDSLVCSKSTSLKTALRLMRQHAHDRLLVTEQDGSLAGMITPMELLDLLIERLPEESAGPEMASVHRIRGNQEVN